MTEYLRLLKEGKINLDALLNATFPIEQVEKAFEQIKSGPQPRPIITILDYGTDVDLSAFEVPEKRIDMVSKPVENNKVQVALVGTGSFATGMHLPNLQKLGDKFSIRAIVNRKGQKAKAVANQYGASYACSDIKEVLVDKDVDLVMITTRHDNHGELVIQSLEAGKHVFVEKPLCTTREELETIESLVSKEGSPLLMVGFNRRFSDCAREIKRHITSRVNPLFIHYRMNAGFIPLKHWVHENGGRIVGEACHIIDLMNFLTGSEIVSISEEHLSPSTEKLSLHDNRSIVLKYADGSVCTIHYFAVGSKKFPKEYMEVHYDEKTIVMDDYKSLSGYGVKVKEMKSQLSKKGQLEELEYLYDSLKNKKEWPIALWDIIQTTKATLEIENL